MRRATMAWVVSAAALAAACNALLGNSDHDVSADASTDTTPDDSHSGGDPGSSSGSSSGADSGSDAGPADGDGGGCTDACTLAKTQCTGSSVQTCVTGNGGCTVWSTVACTGGTPFCANNACSSEPPSCTPGGAGMTSCGPGDASCCASPDVDGGTYSRTYTNDGGGPTGMADPASVSPFRLDEYEVTVGRFRQFVTAWNGGYLPPAGSGKHTHLNGGLGLASVGGDGGVTYETGWLPSDDGNIQPTGPNLTGTGQSCLSSGYATWTGGNEKLPINCVNWWESYAFCIWDGGFLPTEAEWEYAAADGSQLREYPWGSTPLGTSNQYAIYGCHYGSDSGTCSGVTNIAPVGTPAAGAGAWGQLDLAGNVWEWNLDSYAASYVDPCPDCAYLAPASSRVIRGGDYGASYVVLLSFARVGSATATRYSYLGFRCARTP